MRYTISNIGDIWFPELDGEAKHAAAKEWLEMQYLAAKYYIDRRWDEQIEEAAVP